MENRWTNVSENERRSANLRTDPVGGVVKAATLRQAALAAVNAFFDAIEREESTSKQRRVVVRASAKPKSEPSELDRRAAKRMLDLEDEEE